MAVVPELCPCSVRSIGPLHFLRAGQHQQRQERGVISFVLSEWKDFKERSATSADPAAEQASRALKVDSEFKSRKIATLRTCIGYRDGSSGVFLPRLVC